MTPHWTLFDDPQEVAEGAARILVELAEEAIRRRGCFRLVLAGGGTPLLAYRLLARQQQRWDQWEFYFGDERCLPPDDSRRNSQLVREVLFDPARVPDSQIHEIPAELGAEKAALAYEPQVRAALPFDLILLGLGEDGHTASLFPGHEHPPQRLVVPVHDAPKPPPERVSLTAQALSRCRALVFLVTGESKQQALADWRRGKEIPASLIQPPIAPEVLVDEAAWG